MSRHLRSTTISISLCWLLLSFSSAQAETVRVDDSVLTNGPGTASDWSNAFNNLHDALDKADELIGPDVIVVAKGTYKPSASDRSASFVLRPECKVQGGYAGRSVPGVSPDTRNIFLYETVLSGEIGLPVSADNSFHVVSASNLSDGTALDGVTIADGNAFGDTQDNVA